MPLVNHTMNGYHGTYMVYGQTGTGKTHTMGVLTKVSQESAGVIPLSIEFIFKYLDEQKRHGINNLIDYSVHLSFF